MDDKIIIARENNTAWKILNNQKNELEWKDFSRKIEKRNGIFASTPPEKNGVLEEHYLHTQSYSQAALNFLEMKKELEEHRKFLEGTVLGSIFNDFLKSIVFNCACCHEEKQSAIHFEYNNNKYCLDCCNSEQAKTAALFSLKDIYHMHTVLECMDTEETPLELPHIPHDSDEWTEFSYEIEDQKEDDDYLVYVCDYCQCETICSQRIIGMQSGCVCSDDTEQLYYSNENLKKYFT